MKSLAVPFNLTQVFTKLQAAVKRATGPRPRRKSLKRIQGESLESRELLSVSGALSRVGQQISQQATASENRISREGYQSEALSRVGVLNNAAQNNRPASVSHALSPIGRVAALASGDPNDQISEAIAVGRVNSSVTKLGTIDNAHDVDMFMIQVAAGDRISFDTDNSRGFDSVIRLFDSRGVQIAMNDDGAAPGESSSYESYLDHAFTSGGTYYLGVSGYGNSGYNAVTGGGDTSGSTGDYDLTVRRLGSDPPTTRYDTEGNNTISSANYIGAFRSGYHSQTFYGSTGAGSDTSDWTRFQINGRTSGTIQLSGMFQDLDIALYDSTGRLVASSVNTGIRTDTINLNGLQAGTYFLQIRPGVAGARSAYALRFGLSVA